MNKFSIYTDGGCQGNGTENSKGSWAWVLIDNETDQVIDASPPNCTTNTTNQRMELQAVYEALSNFLENWNEFFPIAIYTDSAYITNCFKDRWHSKWAQNNWKNSKKESVKNKDIWSKILDIFLPIPDLITFRKVKGHEGDKWNEYCDQMATSFLEHPIDEIPKEEEKCYE